MLSSIFVNVNFITSRYKFDEKSNSLDVTICEFITFKYLISFSFEKGSMELFI